jgi:hypothetical protein
MRSTFHGVHSELSSTPCDARLESWYDVPRMRTCDSQTRGFLIGVRIGRLRLYEIAGGDDEAVGVYGDELCGVKMSTSHPLAIVGQRGMVPRHLPRAAKITKEDYQS